MNDPMNYAIDWYTGFEWASWPEIGFIAALCVVIPLVVMILARKAVWWWRGRRREDPTRGWVVRYDPIADPWKRNLTITPTEHGCVAEWDTPNNEEAARPPGRQPSTQEPPTAPSPTNPLGR